VRRHKIDFTGAAVLVAGVSALLLALVWGGSEYAWSSGVIVGLLVAGTLLTVLFVLWEARAPEPLLPLTLFHNQVFRVGTAISFVVGASMFGAIVYLPLYLQVVTSASATDSGLLILPLMFGLLTTSIVSGRIITRTGRYKVWPVVGLAVAAVGMFLLSTMTTETSRVVSSAYMVVLGAGLGMVMQVLVLAIQNAVGQRDLGVATSSANFFRSMGGSFGVALFGAILNARLAYELPRLLPESSGGDFRSLLNSPEQIRALPADVAAAVVEAVSRSVTTLFLWAVPLVIVGFVLALFLREIPLRTTAHVGRSTGTQSDDDEAPVVEPALPV
jgi:predicted MFS family arabinose efflux permease